MPDMEKIKVIVADDHVLMREGIVKTRTTSRIFFKKWGLRTDSGLAFSDKTRYRKDRSIGRWRNRLCL